MSRNNEEEAIQRIMSSLKCDRVEAEEVYKADIAIDHDEKTDFDLTAAQNKIAQQYTKTGTRKTPTTYKFTKRERKPNATKGGIIADISHFLSQNSEFSVENLQIPNKEGKISWKIGEKWYSITLTEHRTKPKWCE